MTPSPNTDGKAVVTERHIKAADEVRGEIVKRLHQPDYVEIPYAAILAKHFPGQPEPENLEKEQIRWVEAIRALLANRFQTSVLTGADATAAILWTSHWLKSAKP